MAAFGLLLLAGCSTKKKNFMSRGYHNLTAKYNVYWNGKESLKDGVAKLEKGHTDDYEEILEVFPIGTSESAKSVYSEMDRGIEKASIAISRHSMLIKGKEYVSSIDDAYMLIGKAHFYKRDYMLALEMFNYVIKQYKKNPIRFDGYLWLIRTDTELSRFKDGEKIITKLEEEKAFPKKKVAELAAVKADYFIKKGEFLKAKDQLIVAINKTKRKKSKTRYTYILAQLYEELNNNDSAAYYYTRVLKKSTPYVMEFNARINRALMASAKSGNLASIKKELVKMSKDDKNKEYLDRIYYALGDIAMEEEEKDMALEYFKQSVKYSTSNITQKAVSYYTIGDLYFEKPKYEPAAAYYDSSIAILPNKHEQYERVKVRQESLADLVKNIRIIAREDSLLELGNMSESELSAYIEELIEEVRLAEEQRKFDEANGLTEQQQLQQLQQNQNNGPSAGGSGWYFYNSTALSFGANDFLQKWGNRPREDNWRRSNKQSNAVANLDGLEEDTTQVTTAQLMDPEFYMADIPRTEADRDSSNKRIQYAFYDLGTIYKEQLSENQRAIVTFEELLSRYPSGLFNLETYYQLYRLYKGEANDAKAAEYKAKILREFPDSEYAKILKDPKYLEKLQALKGRIVQMYDLAYVNYTEGEYERTIAAADSALTLFKEGKVLPKFALLRAMAIGKTEKLAVYRSALEEVIKAFPASPEKEKAVELLEYVKGLMGETLADEEVNEEPEVVKEELYVFDFETEHYYAMVIEELGDVSEMKGRISNFNATMFSVENLTIKNLKLSPTEDLIFIQGFKETKKAMDYYHAIVNDTTVFAGISEQQMNQFLISKDNFTKFYASKEAPPYVEFFITKYILKKED